MSRLCLLVVTLLALIDCIQIVTSRIVNLVVLVISLAYNCFTFFICCMSNLAYLVFCIRQVQNINE